MRATPDASEAPSTQEAPSRPEGHRASREWLRRAAAHLPAVAGLLLLLAADATVSRCSIGPDPRFDALFLRRAVLDPDTGRRVLRGGSAIRLTGLWPETPVSVRLTVRSREPGQAVEVHATERVAQSVLGTGTDEIAFATRADGRGELRLRVHTEKGVHLDRLELTQAGPPVIPAGRILQWLALVGTVVLVMRIAGAGPLSAGSVAFAVSFTLAVAVAVARLQMIACLPWLLATAPVSLLFAAAVRLARLPAPGAAWVSVAFALRLGLVVLPGFPVIDALSHAHNVGRLRAELIASRAPGPAREALAVPYPPAFYAVLVPAYSLQDRMAGESEWPPEDLLVRVGLGLLEGTAPLLVFFLMRAGGAGPTPAGLGAAAAAVMPEGLLVLGKGIGPNAFGGWLSLVALTALVARASPVILAGVVALAFLAHLGVTATLGLILAASVVHGLRVGRVDRRTALGTAGAVAAAAAIAWVFYYGQAFHLATRAAGSLAGNLTETPEAFFRVRWFRVGKTAQDLVLKLGAAPLWLAFVGLRRGDWPQPLRDLLLPWMAVGAALGAVALLTPIPLRFEYALLPALAAAAGLGAERLGREGRAWLVGAALAVSLGVQAALGLAILLGRFQFIAEIMESPRWPFPIQ